MKPVRRQPCDDCENGIHTGGVPRQEATVISARTMCRHGVSVPILIEGEEVEASTLEAHTMHTVWQWMTRHDISECSQHVCFTLSDHSVVVLHWNGGNPILGWNLCPLNTTALPDAAEPQPDKWFVVHSAIELVNLIEPIERS